MAIEIVCPLCLTVLEKDSEDALEIIEDIDLESITFHDADEWADHILETHPTDSRSIWAKDYKAWKENEQEKKRGKTKKTTELVK